jgi:hypothetical protein
MGSALESHDLLWASYGDTPEIGQPFLPIFNSSPGGPLCQAIAFASIPCYSVQPCPKKSITGLGLGCPVSLGWHQQVGCASQSATFTHPCVTEGGAPHCSPNNSPSSPSSPSQRMIVGVSCLLRPAEFLTHQQTR